MSAKGKREFWLVAAICTAFLTMIFFVAVVIDGYFRLRSLLVGGAWPSAEQVLNDLGDKWGYGSLLGVFGFASWFSYRKYNKYAGLEPEGEE